MRRRSGWRRPSRAPSPRREPDDHVVILDQLDHGGKRGERAGAVGVAVEAQLAGRLEHPAPHRVALAAVALVAKQPDAVAVASDSTRPRCGPVLALSTTRISHGSAVRVEPARAGRLRCGRDARLLVVGGHHDRDPGARHARQSRMLAPWPTLPATSAGDRSSCATPATAGADPEARVPRTTSRAGTATSTPAPTAGRSTSPALPAASELAGLYREMSDDLYLSEEEGRRATARRLLDLIRRHVPAGELCSTSAAGTGCCSTRRAALATR